MQARSRHLFSHAAPLAFLVPLLAPLVWLLTHGALTSPLWLDEITYFSYAEQWSARRTSLGTEVSPLQGLLFSMFSYPNVLSLYLRAADWLHVAWRHRPEVVLRLPSVACFVASVILTWYYARRRGRATGALAAIAVSSLPLLEFYAFEAKGYAISGLLALAWAIAAARLCRRPGRRWILLVAVLGFLLPYFSVWCSPLLLSLPAWALLGRFSRRDLGAALLAVAPGLALACVQVYFLRHDFAHQTNLWFSHPIGASELLIGLARNLWTAPSYLPPHAPEWLQRIGVVAAMVAVSAMVATLLYVRRRGDFVAFAFVVGIALLSLVTPWIDGFVLGRYETPLMLVGVAALCSLPHPLRHVLYGAFIALGCLSIDQTRGRIDNRSNTRSMIAAIRRSGDPTSEAIVTRPNVGWDPLHRYTTWFYAQKMEPRWRAIDYPSMEELGRDFMLLSSVVRSARSVERVANRNNPSIVDWVRQQHLDGLWVLSPLSEGEVPLSALLAGEGLLLTERQTFHGTPESALLHYRREP